MDRRDFLTAAGGTILAAGLGLSVHAGHGLTYENVAAVARIAPCEELNIGHAIVARALFTGVEQAVGRMLECIGGPTPS